MNYPADSLNYVTAFKTFMERSIKYYSFLNPIRGIKVILSNNFIQQDIIQMYWK